MLMGWCRLQPLLAHRRRGAHRGLSLAPTLTTDEYGVWQAIPSHIKGDVAGPTFASAAEHRGCAVSACDRWLG